MTNRLAILLIGACYIGLAWSAQCDGPIQQYRQCTDKIRSDREAESQQKQAQLQGPRDQCFTSAGCKVPAGDEPNNNNGQQQCHKDINEHLKSQVRDCVRKTQPGFDFPPENQNQQTTKKFKGGKKEIEKACGGSADKVKQVEQCLKNNRPPKVSEDQQKLRFQQNCDNKKKCETSLGPCRPQLDALQKTVCQCNQDVRTDQNMQNARNSSPSCKNAPTPKPRQEKTKPACGDRPQQKDWCTEGYEAWKASQKANAGNHKGGQGQNGGNGR